MTFVEVVLARKKGFFFPVSCPGLSTSARQLLGEIQWREDGTGQDHSASAWPGVYKALWSTPHWTDEQTKAHNGRMAP